MPDPNPPVYDDSAETEPFSLGQLDKANAEYPPLGTVILDRTLLSVDVVAIRARWRQRYGYDLPEYPIKRYSRLIVHRHVELPSKDSYELTWYSATLVPNELPEFAMSFDLIDDQIFAPPTKATDLREGGEYMILGYRVRCVRLVPEQAYAEFLPLEPIPMEASHE